MSVDRAAAGEMTAFSIFVDPVPESSRDARRFVSSRLADERWDSIRDTAVLLTSELVTNAFVHSASAAEVSVTLGDEVTVFVRDADTGPLLARSGGELDEGGRGMFLVDQLADRWGTEHSRGRKTVWFCLRPSEHGTALPPEKDTGVAAPDPDLPPALVAGRRLEVLVMDRELETLLTPREQVTEILERTVSALDAKGAVLEAGAELGELVAAGRPEGLSHRQRLEVGGETYGYLDVFSDRKFGTEEEAFVRLAAQRLALCLATNELLDASRKRNADIQLLAEATELLAGSTSLAHVLSLSVQIAVPNLSEWAAAYIIDERGRPIRVTATHADESRLDPVLAFLDNDPELKGVLRAAAHSDEAVRLPGALSIDGQPHHAMVVPLLSRRETTGLLLLGRLDPPDPSAHLAILELSRRVGLALDNARLHEQVTGAASALQASLVPPELPKLAHLELAASYHAATPSVAVGGDFYDVFELDDGSVILIVGDVCGKGPAAAAMARTSRDVLRLLLDDGWPVIAALRRLNRALRDHSYDEKFCTIAVARFYPHDGDGRLTVCLAGHPPPLVLGTSGAAKPIGTPGGILGVLPDRAVALEEVECTLGPGESLVLYTDGVTEARRGPEMFGLHNLTALLSEVVDPTPHRIADAVHDAAAKFSSNTLRDDLAVLVARRTPRAE
ncbi:MAG TPA: ATP-binding SpoIIE family protein phosphatase [Acidimicrobiales bacterium]|nr:ATP-binding SpoIIE family protein phosphatase [Acidimicrobiales bacterium]